MQRTRRGVYLDIANSPIAYTGRDGYIYRFSSKKKREMYLKRIEEYQQEIDKLNGKLYRYTGSDKNFNLERLYIYAERKAYIDMRIL